MEPTTFVGLDVRKRITSVAIAESGRGGKALIAPPLPGPTLRRRGGPPKTRDSAHASS